MYVRKCIMYICMYLWVHVCVWLCRIIQTYALRSVRPARLESLRPNHFITIQSMLLKLHVPVYEWDCLRRFTCFAVVISSKWTLLIIPAQLLLMAIHTRAMSLWLWIQSRGGHNSFFTGITGCAYVDNICKSMVCSDSIFTNDIAK